LFRDNAIAASAGRALLECKNLYGFPAVSLPELNYTDEYFDTHDQELVGHGTVVRKRVYDDGRIVWQRKSLERSIGEERIYARESHEVNANHPPALLTPFSFG